MPIDFTKKKAAPKTDMPIPAGKAKIPAGFASRAIVPEVPSEAALKEASEKSPLHHPGDQSAKAEISEQGRGASNTQNPSAASNPAAVKNTPSQTKTTSSSIPDKPTKPRGTAKRTKNGLVEGIATELYIRGTPRKSVLIEGPEETIEAFKAFVQKRGVKNWEALQLLVQGD